MTKMTTEEAFVKVLQMHGIEHAFGIIGSAFMPISDIFPDAGITFWDVAHETNGGLIADGYTRATGKMSMVIAQNGPGITGLVTPIKTAYWNHTPLLLVTPQAANKTMGQGGFQEVEQMNLFKDMVCYQEEVRDPSRMAEVLNRVIEKAIRSNGWGEEREWKGRGVSGGDISPIQSSLVHHHLHYFLHSTPLQELQPVPRELHREAIQLGGIRIRVGGVVDVKLRVVHPVGRYLSAICSCT